MADFSSALGDASWSDVKFVAEGRPIFAHRNILVSASDYFAALFRTMPVNGSITEINVPDSYVSTLRLLLWIYSQDLPPSDNLLDDLISADRFQLLDLKGKVLLRIFLLQLFVLSD